MTVLAGGAYGNDENGFSAGQVRVFSYDAGFDLSNQRGQDLNGKEEQTTLEPPLLCPMMEMLWQRASAYIQP